jgi:hypothetical protein
VRSKASWTTPAELVAQLQRLWDRGEVLRSAVTDGALFPKPLRLRRPTSTDLGSRFDEVRQWIRALEAAQGFTLEFEEIVHRQLGRNRVPGRVWVSTEADALRILGKQRAAENFHSLRRMILAAIPALDAWVTAFPLKVLEFEDQWERVIAVLLWFERNPQSRLYRRQLEIEKVDTKFIENHRQLLWDLLERVLPQGQPALERGVSFDRRFGLKEKPGLVRFRILDPAQHIRGLSDLSVPAAELAQLDLPVDDVIVTENEVNGLALLPRQRTLVVFGQGYALERLAEVPWLGAKRLLYWGDIDTHGFAMLDRFRAHFPLARSFLMDEETLLAHRLMWVSEPEPSTESLTRLTDGERSVYRALVRGTHGERLRLEQERIGFRWVREALEALGA